MFSDFDLYSPQTFYAASKKASEDLLSFFSQANNLSITILYLYDVYGPKQPHKRFLNLFINAIKSGEDFHMSQGAQEVNFIHMKDVIDGILYSILNKLPKNFENIAKYSLHSNETFKLAELPSLITAALEFENLPIAVIKDLPYREREIFSFKPKYPLPPGWNSKIQFRDGIRDLI
jgi:nucleoside-diphosphate-sugar epimerase